MAARVAGPEAPLRVVIADDGRPARRFLAD
jgi:hypothetical protein